MKEKTMRRETNLIETAPRWCVRYLQVEILAHMLRSALKALWLIYIIAQCQKLMIDGVLLTEVSCDKIKEELVEMVKISVPGASDAVARAISKIREINEETFLQNCLPREGFTEAERSDEDKGKDAETAGIVRFNAEELRQNMSQQ